jgi:F-type H+-transporting ATPase subunit a
MPSRRPRTRLAVATAGLTAPLLAALVTAPAHAAEEFNPSDEFKLTPIVDISLFGLDLSITKAVIYLFIALALTVGTMVLVARRMTQKPNRIQTAVEMTYGLMRDNITYGNLDREMGRKWFPFIATLFLFIWFSNFIGYVPLPFAPHNVSIFGIEVPALAIYATTANLSMPLALALVVWLTYHAVGVRKQGPVKYVKSWIPAGVNGPIVALILPIEALSHVVRLLSLSLRLYANILAGHLLILFMAGGLVVLLALPLFGTLILGTMTAGLGAVFFIFEIGLVVTLQAFIFATLTAIYLGGAVAGEH